MYLELNNIKIIPCKEVARLSDTRYSLAQLSSKRELAMAKRF